MSKPFIYKSSNGCNYYFSGGSVPPHKFITHDYEFWQNEFDVSKYLSAIPAGYTIIEKSDGTNQPLLISEKHLRLYPGCQWETVFELVDDCDQMWYSSALGSPERRPQKERMIKETIEKLVDIEKAVSCSECRMEIKTQVEFQKKEISAQ